MNNTPIITVSVRDALVDVLGVDRATQALDADDMIAAGLLDSFAIIEFAARIEERLNVAIPTEALNQDSFRCHASVVAMVESLKGAEGC